MSAVGKHREQNKKRFCVHLILTRPIGVMDSHTEQVTSSLPPQGKYSYLSGWWCSSALGEFSVEKLERHLDVLGTVEYEISWRSYFSIDPLISIVEPIVVDIQSLSRVPLFVTP